MRTATRIVFVTGKGGVGKTVAAAALARHAAANGWRTLLLETAPDGNLAALFRRAPCAVEATRLVPNLDGVRVDARGLLEDYFRRTLRFAFLADRLFASSTFNALTAAAPGITEFLLLDRLLGIAEPGLGRRRRYDLLVVDGPATGHALKLLRAPRNILAMVPGGPLSSAARRMRALIEDHARTSVLVVSLPEEMAVRETIELCQTVRDELGVRLARPVVNRVFPRRFARDEIAALAVGDAIGEAATLAAGAQFVVARRREAERHVAHLRRALGENPVLFRQLFAPHLDAEHLTPLGRTIGKSILVDPAGAQS